MVLDRPAQAISKAARKIRASKPASDGSAWYLLRCPENPHHPPAAAAPSERSGEFVRGEILGQRARTDVRLD